MNGSGRKSLGLEFQENQLETKMENKMDAVCLQRV